MSIPAALSRRRDYSGPALFSYGFRPFFLGAAAWAALSVLLWVPRYLGEFDLPTAFAPLDWHSHEMLYGYVGAVIAGFLLTAIPNWTGRLPVSGLSLALLAALWFAGRVAILMSAKINAVAVAAIDVAFLVALAAVALREIVAGKNWRNLRVLAVVAVLIASNVAFHAEALSAGTATYAPRVGLAAILTLIILIGGRIVPSFTHNWLVRANPGRLPVPFSRFDAVSIVASVVALIAWAAPWRDGAATGLLLLLAGALQLRRLSRWAGERTVADRLVLVLHVAYAFVPLGFFLAGAAVLWPGAVPATAGLHAWGTGAVGMMTLAVMTRASLGHTGQPLVASPATQIIYLCAFVAALARILAAFGGTLALLYVAAFAWVAAFGGFVLVFGPLLVGRPPIWAGRAP